MVAMFVGDAEGVKVMDTAAQHLLSEVGADIQGDACIPFL